MENTKKPINLTRAILPENDSFLPLMEHFYTIQGEGVQSGKAAYFLRLGGCDVGCHWCDVKESWDISAHPLVGVLQMVQWVKEAGATQAVITGGEPAMHDLTALTQALRLQNIQCWIETSGAYPLTGYFDWICVSPKKFKPAQASVLELAHELKVVIYHPSDFQWAEQFIDKVSPHCALLLQPEWSRMERMLPEMITYVKKKPYWKISLQTHKFMQIP